MIQTIRDFLEGTGGEWDWDDFISFPTGYPGLDAVQAFCLGLPADYPPTEPAHSCDPDGVDELRRKLEQLEAEESQWTGWHSSDRVRWISTASFSGSPTFH